MPDALRLLRSDEVAAGDTLTMQTAIRRGDVVVLERTGPGEVRMRALDPAASDVPPGPRYRIDRGPEGGLVLDPLNG